jgi:hypothetical protein
LGLLALAAHVSALPSTAQARARDGEPFERISGQQSPAAEHAAAGRGVSRDGVESFDAGYALVRAMYFARDAAGRDKSRDAAVVELACLVDRFEGQAEGELLRKILRTVIRRTGAPRERWDAVQRVIDEHAARLDGPPRWYFKAAVSLAKITVFSFMEDQTNLHAELSGLPRLAADAPADAPDALLKPMRDLSRLVSRGGGGQTADHETIAGATGAAMISILG